MPLNLDNLDDAEQFAKHFVKPVVDQLSARLEPLVLRVADVEKRLDMTEARLGKVMKVYTALLAGLTFAGHWTWNKLTRKL